MNIFYNTEFLKNEIEETRKKRYGSWGRVWKNKV